MGEWDLEAVRRLFTSLEFRTLFERLEEVGRSAKPAVEVAELDLREVDVAEAVELVAAERAEGDPARSGRPRGREAWPSRWAGGRPRSRRSQDLEAFAAALGETRRRSGSTTPRTSRRRSSPRAGRWRASGPTRCSPAYLLDPAAPSFELQRAERAVPRGRRARLGRRGGRGRSCSATRGDGPRPRPRRWRCSRRCIDERIDKAGLRRLLDEVELPLSSVLARMQATGVALDVAYLEEMAEGVRRHGWRRCRSEIYRARRARSSTSTRRRSSARSCTRSSGSRRARGRPRGSSPPTRASSRSSATCTRSSTRSCPGASSTS